ncbi:hypothetical protein GIB67_006761 [Kingdonia uniflora]|uniref:SAM-dependent MTase RsmB/NOP-type domain-containing protein n=1 Tax=Kingdonia uniflora TaxID=39325 RepID=A0A7J7LZ40_9MAGN|nr:hypothetical protein GIB67_006761 [Kingdonia uniflora]
MAYEEVIEAEDDHYQMVHFHYLLISEAKRRNSLWLLAEEAVTTEDEAAEICPMESRRVSRTEMTGGHGSVGATAGFASSFSGREKSCVNLIVKEIRRLSVERDLGKKSSSSDRKLSEKRRDRSFSKRHPGKADDCCSSSTGWFSMRSKPSTPTSKFVVSSNSEETSSSGKGDECNVIEETVNSVGTTVKVGEPSRAEEDWGSYVEDQGLWFRAYIFGKGEEIVYYQVPCLEKWKKDRGIEPKPSATPDRTNLLDCVTRVPDELKQVLSELGKSCRDRCRRVESSTFCALDYHTGFAESQKASTTEYLCCWGCGHGTGDRKGGVWWCRGKTQRERVSSSEEVEKNSLKKKLHGEGGSHRTLPHVVSKMKELEKKLCRMAGTNPQQLEDEYLEHTFVVALVERNHFIQCYYTFGLSTKDVALARSSRYKEIEFPPELEEEEITDDVVVLPKKASDLPPESIEPVQSTEPILDSLTDRTETVPPMEQTLKSPSELPNRETLTLSNNPFEVYETKSTQFFSRFSSKKSSECVYVFVCVVIVSAVRLMRIEFGGDFADLLNEKGKGSGDNEMEYVERTLGFRTRDLEDRDLRLVTDIVGGTIRWRRYLDHLIVSLCHDERTFRGMEPLLLQILRIGVYEIVKLDMPPYAVVDENARLAKVALIPGAGNMVNGILRKLVSLKVWQLPINVSPFANSKLGFDLVFVDSLLFQENNSLPLPKLEGEDRAQSRALATLYSHPVWMVRRWIKFHGQEEAEKLMTLNNSDPSFSLRANTSKDFTKADLVSRLNMLKVPHELSPHLDDFVRLTTGMQIVSGLVVSVVDPQQGETIIDCCAAPGGKTLFMASRLRGQGMVSAIDINEGRLRILKETAKLHGVHDVITSIHADLRIFAEDNPVQSDKVLLDVPCSGLGVLSKICKMLTRLLFIHLLKRADLRWNRRLEDMEELKNLQNGLLDAASMLVKPGGVLVYSTCSIDPEENEERVAVFLQRHPLRKYQFEILYTPEFCVDPVDRYVPPAFVTNSGFYFSNPVKHYLDGSFAARLIRSL